jgi:hypothetical protein
MTPVASPDDDVAQKNNIVAKAGRTILSFMLISTGVAKQVLFFSFDTQRSNLNKIMVGRILDYPKTSAYHSKQSNDSGAVSTNVVSVII